MREEFDRQLELLNQKMTTMGRLCEEAISKSSNALYEGNISMEKSVSMISEKIEKMEKDIESLAFNLFLKQQPVAKDLRVVSAALKMITDMSRIGDQSSDIAEIIATSGVKTKGDNVEIHNMTVAVIKMVKESLSAFVKKDSDLAKAVIQYDDVVDKYFDDIKSQLVKILREDNIDGERALDLLMIIKYLERIGDHAVNIAGWVMFSITGEHKSL